MAKLLIQPKFLYVRDADALLSCGVHQPDTFLPLFAFSLQIFDCGTEIGILAQQYLGEDIQLTPLGFIENIEQTGNALDSRKLIFENRFLSELFLCV